MIISTPKFLKESKSWKKESNVQTFSNRHQIWCHGVINYVDGDMLMVFYSNIESNSFSKKLSRWSTQQSSGKRKKLWYWNKRKNMECSWSMLDDGWDLWYNADFWGCKLLPIDSNHLKLLTWDNGDINKNRHCRNNAIEAIKELIITCEYKKYQPSIERLHLS